MLNIFDLIKKAYNEKNVCVIKFLIVNGNLNKDDILKNNEDSLLGFFGYFGPSLGMKSYIDYCVIRNECFIFLIKHFNLVCDDFSFVGDCKTKYGKIYYYCSACAFSLEAVKLLLSIGFEQKLFCTKYPLLSAISHNNIKVLKFLFEELQIKKSEWWKDEKLFSGFEYTIDYVSEEIVQYVASHGIRIINSKSCSHIKTLQKLRSKPLIFDKLI